MTSRFPVVRPAVWSPPRFGDNQSRTYDELDDPGRDGYASPNYPSGRKTYDPFLLQTMARYLKPGDAVLELGCNKGNNLLPLAPKYEVYGLDINRAFIDEVCQDAKDQGIEASVKAEVWDFAEDGTLPKEWGDMQGKFKAINAVHVLSHLPDQDLIRVMQAMQQYLAPGGVMVATIITPEKEAEKPARNQTLLNSLKAYFLNDSLAGFNAHSQETVEKAFAGLELVKARSFNPGELQHWILPEERLRWVVYRKPSAATEVANPFSAPSAKLWV